MRLVIVSCDVMRYQPPHSDVGRHAAPGSVAQPGNVSPDSAAPDRAAPDSAAPDSAAPECAAPDSAAPDSVAPDSAAPVDSAAPDSAAPDSAAPDSAAPDSTAPDSATPDSAAPDSAAPDNAAPDSAAPESTQRRTAQRRTAQRRTAQRRTAQRRTAQRRRAVCRQLFAGRAEWPRLGDLWTGLRLSSRSRCHTVHSVTLRDVTNVHSPLSPASIDLGNASMACPPLPSVGALSVRPPPPSLFAIRFPSVLAFHRRNSVRRITGDKVT